MNSPRSKIFQSVKKSLSYLTSSQSTMSSDNPLSEESYAFLEMFCSPEKILSVSIQKVNKITESSSSFNTYASYEISVLTDDVYYKVGKRYTEFKKLFETVCKYRALQIAFPRKTYWYSGASDCVTTQRQQQLNGTNLLIGDFLQKIHKQIEQPNIGLPFLKFLELQENYRARGLTQTKLQLKDKYLNGNINQYLLLQMHKLNANSQNIIHILRQFQKCLIINRIRVQNLTIKNIINGSNDYMGIIQIIFASDNQLVVQQGFTLLLNLFSIETNIFFECYIKLYQSIPFSLLKELEIELLKNNQIKKMYFELINIYAQGKSQQQLTINQIFNQKKPYFKEFKLWIKELKNKYTEHRTFSSQSKKSIETCFNFQIFQLQRSKSQKNKLIQKEQYFFYTPQLPKEQINSYNILDETKIDESKFVVQLLSTDNHFLQFHSQTNKSYQQLKQKLQNLQWCSIFQDIDNPIEDDIIYCSLKNVDKIYKKFKFIVEKFEGKNQTKILFKPVKEIVGGIILYIKVQIKKPQNDNISKIKIIFYMGNSKAKKFFTQVVRATLMQNVVQTLLLAKQ